jgi:hypothetical protein
MQNTTYISPAVSLADTEWGAMVEFTDPLIGTPDELLRLYSLSPNDEARAFIVGIMDTLQTMAMVTGCPFDIPEGAIDHPLNRADPEWVAGLDSIDALLCRASDLQELLNEAPTDELKGFITGIMDVRQMLFVVTGAEF